MSERIAVGDSSEVVVGRGLPDPILPPRPDREAVAVLHQGSVAAVADQVASRLPGLRVSALVLPDREEAKDLAVVADVYRRLAEVNLGRHDTVVGVGGGALTDAAGFVAATWLRGIESVMMPTTLLGAVDAAVGGKTGVNLRLPGEAGTYAKNLVGAFWHPARVVVDLDVLERLPSLLRLEGTAEILKAGLVADPGIVEEYGRHGPDASLDLVVPAAIRVKAGVVSEDFREGGRRAILNFGHTIGHAVEGATGMAHGLAVAVGMVAEAAVSAARFGFDHDALAHLVFRLGLPVAAAGASRRACLELVARDKKRSRAGVRMVLLREVGVPEVVEVSSEEIERGLDAVGVV